MTKQATTPVATTQATTSEATTQVSTLAGKPSQQLQDLTAEELLLDFHDPEENFKLVCSEMGVGVPQTTPSVATTQIDKVGREIATEPLDKIMTRPGRSRRSGSYLYSVDIRTRNK